MGLKRGWKNLSYWMRGGIVFFMISLIISSLVTILIFTGYWYHYLPESIIILILPGFLFSFKTMIMVSEESIILSYLAFLFLNLVINGIFYIFIGIIIGWIYELLKNKK